MVGQTRTRCHRPYKPIIIALLLAIIARRDQMLCNGLKDIPMNLLRTLFQGKKAPAAPKPEGRSPTLPNPTTAHFVVGDLHGCLDLLEHILEKIDRSIGEHGLQDPKLVFVGDYIDRGPSSAAVLKRLYELSSEFPQNVTCILGNHEQMMLDFLETPEARHARWFRNGASQTLGSFGIQLPPEADWAADALDLASRLQENMGAQTEDWLRSLPLSVQSGNLIITHAGIDPGRSIADQSPRVLLWGHPEFLVRPVNGDYYVAHGHTVMEHAVFEEGRISVDTGGYQTGCLTAAMVLPSGEVEFLQTISPRADP